jgi:hypothetical protein
LGWLPRLVQGPEGLVLEYYPVCWSETVFLFLGLQRKPMRRRHPQRHLLLVIHAQWVMNGGGTQIGGTHIHVLHYQMLQ